jgi:hypothetical protein
MTNIFAAAVILTLLASTAPAVAQNQHDQNRGHQQSHRPQSHRSPPRRSTYHEGQVWQGHRVTNRGGQWGYYQPRNGAQVFIKIPL